MSTKFTNDMWRMPRNANQSKSSNYSWNYSVNAKFNISSPANAGITSSISFWFKRAVVTSVSQPYEINGSYGMWMSNTTMYIKYGSSGYQTVDSATGLTQDGLNALTSTDWVHWVLIREATATSTAQNFKMYANTKEVFSSSSPSNFGTNNTEVDRIWATNQSQSTSIDSFSVFNYALSPSQITTLYGSSSIGIGNPMSLSPKPVAYYSLGEYEAYNGANYLTPNDSLKDYVFDFGGSNDYIDCGNDSTFNITSAITVSAWVKASSSGWVSSFPFFATKGINVSYMLFARKVSSTSLLPRLRIGINGDPNMVEATTSINSTDWHHILGTFDGSTMKIYVNGQLDNSKSLSQSIPTGTDNFTIGGTSGGGTSASMSNVQIFNTVLSGTEVTTLYNYGSPIQTLASIPQNSNLKAWYKLDASEVYNSSTTEWSIDNNQNPSAYPSSLDFVSSESDYIQIPYNTNLTPQNGNFTISAWINTDNLSGWHPIWSTQNLSSGTKVVALHTYDNKVRATVGGSTNNPSYAGSWALFLDSTQSLITSTWYHIAVTFNMSGNAQIYINGSADNSGPIENPQTSWDTGDRFIGDGEGFWDGKISNISIFNTALGQPDITSLYNNGTPLSDMSSFTSLVSWYKLNNTTTGIGNSLSPWTSSLSFDGGINNGITIQNDSSLEVSSQFTMSCWFKSETSQNSYAYPVYKASSNIYHGAYGFYIQNNATLVSTVIDTGSGVTILTSDSLGDLRDGKWHHVVQIYDGTQMKVYLDGNQSGSAKLATGTVDYSPTYQDLYIGKTRHTTPSGLYSFKGEVSNVQFFNTALPATGSNSVQTIYNIGVPLSDMSSFSSLVSWWKLNNTTTGVQDSKGSNNGTNNGATESIGLVSTLNGTNNGATEYTGFVNTLAGESSGMTQANLVQSDLSFTSSYSPYALDFDGANDYIDCGTISSFSDGDISFSLWCNLTTTNTYQYILSNTNSSGVSGINIAISSSGLIYFERSQDVANTQNYTGYSVSGFSYGNWHHLCGSYNSTSGELKAYVDGVLKSTTNDSTNTRGASQSLKIGGLTNSSLYSSNGSISNVSVWNTALTSAQVTEIYNEGVPSNLNNHSAYSNLVSWWQLGSNTYWADPYWIALDEKGTNNGQSQNIAAPNNMGEDAIVDGVGSYANAVSVGLSALTYLAGEAPYSTANAKSINMGVTARGTDVP